MREYISDIIKDEYKTWEDGKTYYISADCGAGKTYFVFNVLLPYAKESGDNILYLCNRLSLKNEIQYLSLSKKQRKIVDIGLGETEEFIQFFGNNEASPFDVITYQKLETIMLQRFTEYGTKLYDKIVSQYKYIIADEFHYILEDSRFNDNTYLSLMFLQKERNNQKNVLISATGFHAFLSLNILPQAVKKYTLKTNKSYIDNITFYYNRKIVSETGKIESENCAGEYISDILQNSDSDKIVYFAERVSDIEKLIAQYPLIQENAVAIYSPRRNERTHPSVELEEIYGDYSDIKRENDGNMVTFDKRVLLTTEYLYNGISLKDKRIKHIVCEISDLYILKQCIGRKRNIDEDDRLNLYIKYHYISEYKLESERQADILTISSHLMRNNKTLYDFIYGEVDGKKRNINDLCKIGFINFNLEQEPPYYYDKENLKQSNQYPITIDFNLAKEAYAFQYQKLYGKMNKYSEEADKEAEKFGVSKDAYPYIKAFQDVTGINYNQDNIRIKVRKTEHITQREIDDVMEPILELKHQKGCEELENIKRALYRLNIPGKTPKTLTRSLERYGYKVKTERGTRGEERDKTFWIFSRI